jgi:hypothetical protein
MSKDSYQVTEYSVMLDSTEHPEMNRAQFGSFVDQELNKFIAMLTSLNAEFVALQDLTALKVPTKFYFINGYAAARQLTVYDARTDGIVVRLDAQVLIKESEAPAANTAFSVLPVVVKDPIPPPATDDTQYPVAEFV